MNWGQIKAAVAGYANRSDLTSMMATFASAVEQRLYQGEEEKGLDQLRVADMLTTVSPFVGTTLPADWLQTSLMTVQVDSSRRVELKYRTPAQIAGYVDSVGYPAFFTIRGQQVIYGPTFSYPVELIYYAEMPSMVSDSSTNWMATRVPMVYIKGMMVEVGKYLKDPDMVAQYEADFLTAARGMLNNDEQSQRSGSALTIVTDHSLLR